MQEQLPECKARKYLAGAHMLIRKQEIFSQRRS